MSIRAHQWTSRAMAVATVFLVATADEIHQTFLPNRTGCFSDVVLDTAGAASLQLALILGLVLYTHFREESASTYLNLNAQSHA